MEIISGEIGIYTGMDNSFREFANEGKERDRTKILEEFIDILEWGRHGLL